MPSPIQRVQESRTEHVFTSSPQHCHNTSRHALLKKELSFMELVRALRSELYNELELSTASSDLPSRISREKIRTLKNQWRSFVEQSLEVSSDHEYQEQIIQLVS